MKWNAYVKYFFKKTHLWLLNILRNPVDRDILQIAVWLWKVGQADPVSNLYEVLIQYIYTEEIKCLYQVFLKKSHPQWYYVNSFVILIK